MSAETATLSRVVHATLTFERAFKAPPDRVFKAWSDGPMRAKWDVPDDNWEVFEHAQDFRVGGMEKSKFGPKGDPIYMSVGWYLDIIPNRRIVSAGTMHGNGISSSMTLCTIEIFPEARRSEERRVGKECG